MKIKNNFFLGMAAGLAIGFTLFSVNVANSHTENMKPTKSNLTAITADDMHETHGGFITPEEAAILHENFNRDFVQANELPSTTSIGGVIGEKNIRDIIGIMGDTDLKYRFYYDTDEAGVGHLGLLFYSPNEGENVLRSGPGSYCPVLCD